MSVENDNLSRNMKTIFLEAIPFTESRLEKMKKRLIYVNTLLQTIGPAPSEGCFLLLAKDHEPERWFELGEKDVVTLGRALESDIVLNDENISRNHCRFESEGTSWRLFDNGATNSIYVNGEKTESRTLCDGDLISLIDYDLVFVKNILL